ncbi:MAG: outer membrane beta-barrel protein, partial [Henriciella sp.]|uniref:outer membrane beta-barrel protein n=1 Tax=Henriciella sp. TaxID=1968823 RepID=UPI003C70D784
MRLPVIFLLISATSATSAYAQDSFFERNRYTAVTERPQPEFDPVPLRAGGFDVQPSLGLEAGYRENLFATEDDTESDAFVQASPSVNAQSTWSRHSLRGRLEAVSTAYAENDSENHTDLRANAEGRLDLGTRTELTGSLIAESLNEPRSASARVANAEEPVMYDRTGAGIGVSHEAGRVRVDGTYTFQTLDFDDVGLIGGGVQDQDFRDYDEQELSSRVSWAVERDWAVFVQGAYVDRSYDQTTPGAVSRDATGVIARTGVDFELQNLIRGDIGVGYQSFDFDDQAIEDIDGLSVDANAQWFVTQLTTVSASAARTVVDSGIISSPGTVVTRVAAGIDHELRRNVIIGGELGFENRDFQEIDRSDDLISV